MKSPQPSAEFITFSALNRYHVIGVVSAMLNQGDMLAAEELLKEVLEVERQTRNGRDDDAAITWDDLRAMMRGTLTILLKRLEGA